MGLLGNLNPFGGGGGGGGGDTTVSGFDKNSANQTISTSTTLGVEEGFALNTTSGNITVADPGSIDQAFKFAKESLGLIEKNTSAVQQTFETALSKSLGIADETKTAGSNRILGLGIAAFVALAAVAYIMRRS